MDIEKKKKIFEELSQYVTKTRAEKIQKVAEERTKHISIVLEDINQSHNISAVLRSADCFGLQEVHIIEQVHKYKVNEAISKGASKWLDLFRYNQLNENNTQICFENLRAQGYKIVAATPHEKDMTLDNLPIDNKFALVFGTEEWGLSSYTLTHADMFVKIPMHGFTESFNISVCAAICLYEVTTRLRKSEYNWRLSEEEIIDLQLDWLGRSTNREEQIKDLINK